MPMVRAMRTMNGIEAGTIDGTQLQTLLSDGGRLSDFNSIMTLPGQSAVVAASPTAMTAITQSTTAINSLLSFNASQNAISGSSVALSALYAVPSAVTTMSNNASIMSGIAFNAVGRSYTTTSGRSALGTFLTGPNSAPWYENNTWGLTGSAAGNATKPTSRGNTAFQTIFANNMYVAVGESGLNGAWYSSDLFTWNRVNGSGTTQFENANYYCLAYGAGRFVAISQNGSFTTSTDGINWSNAGTMPTKQGGIWTELIFANNRFVAISGGTAASNTIAWSDDGLTWTAATLPSSNRWTSLSFGAGLFVAVTGGDSGGSATSSYATSTNGTTWTARTFPMSVQSSCVRFDNGIFMVPHGANIFSGGGTFSNEVLTSTDGLSWTVRNPGNSTTWSSVAFGNGRWVISASSSAQTRYSTDNGASWATLNGNSIFGNGDGDARRIHYFSDTKVFQFVRFGDWNPSYLADEINSASLSLNQYYVGGDFVTSAVAFGNGVYIAAGNGIVFRSTDGLNWKRYLTPIFMTPEYSWPVLDLKFANGIFVAIINYGVSTSWIYTSTDGIRWTQRSLASRFHTSCTYSPTLGRWIVVAGGKPGMSSSASTTGYSWSTNNFSSYSNGNFPGSLNYSSIAWDGVRFYAVGNSTTFYTSTDGSNWTSRNANGINNGIQTVIASNGTAIFTDNGDRSYVCVTFDGGINSSQISMPSSKTWTAAVAANGQYMVFSQTGDVVATSKNGASWSQKTFANLGNTILQANYCNGFFIGSSTTGPQVGVVNL